MVWALTQRATRSPHRDHLMNPEPFLEGEAAKTRERKQNRERYVNAAEFLSTTRCFQQNILSNLTNLLRSRVIICVVIATLGRTLDKQQSVICLSHEKKL